MVLPHEKIHANCFQAIFGITHKLINISPLIPHSQGVKYCLDTNIISRPFLDKFAKYSRTPTVIDPVYVKMLLIF